MMTSLAAIPAGKSISRDGHTWTVLDHDKTLGASLCLCDDIVSSLPFDNTGHNNFIKSTCYRDYLKAPNDQLAENPGAFPVSPIDLTASNGSKLYGTPSISSLFLLTEDQFQKYKNIIPPSTRPWWLATAVAPVEEESLPWKRNTVLAVVPERHSMLPFFAKVPLGIRPARWLKDETTVDTCEKSSESTPNNSLNHIMVLDDEDCCAEDRLLAVKTILFNSNHISSEEALRIVRVGEYSPYVLAIPKEQFYGLFKDQPANPSERLQMPEEDGRMQA